MYGGITLEGKMEYAEIPIRGYEKFGIRGSQIGHPQRTSRICPLPGRPGSCIRAENFGRLDVPGSSRDMWGS